MLINGSTTKIPLPKQFLASGINCGVRRYRPDLGVIISQTPATTVAVFTQNAGKAAPVRYCENLLPSNNIRAIITNSGQANAATGPDGERNNFLMAKKLADSLKCHSNQVLTASTGVIGEAMEIDKITQAIPELLETAVSAADKFALAILTTDLVPKWCSKTVELSTGSITITGLCKGSGMIHPNMATMLAYLCSDVKLNCTQAASLLKKSVDVSFNMISVDGECSTNDTAFLMCNGASGIGPQNDNDLLILEQALKEISTYLAKCIVSDGEGATKFLEVEIINAESEILAAQIARSITCSSLIKTALFGESANWGRVLARLGMNNVSEAVLNQCDITFQNKLVYSNGAAVHANKNELTTAMQENKISIQIDLKTGNQQAKAWGCDLSETYVKINANYLT